MNTQRTVPGWRVLAGGAALCSALLLVGCGAQTGNLSGKVTYKGNPVKGGTVIFMTADTTKVVRANIEDNGNYSAKGLPVGEMIILVESAWTPPKIPGGAKTAPPAGQKPPEGHPEAKAGAKGSTLIPARYSDPKQTDLKVTVKGGDQQHDVPLK
jgi:hypothetical protein